MRDSPLVSCIMPVHGRHSFVMQAVKYFQRQDYPRRELVIVDDSAEPLRPLLPDDPAIRYVRVPRMSLGAKRNAACRAARGAIIVHWDDDDWMTPWRLRYQVNTLLYSGADVCGVAQMMYYDVINDQAWQYRYGGSRPWVMGNSLCYTRAAWERQPFADVNTGEDTRFLWGGAPRRIASLARSDFMVGIIHGRNASPKPTGAYWQRRRTSDIYKWMRHDWLFYRSVPSSRDDSLPLVSCMMPTYNRRPFVAQAIAYFLRQTYPNRELVIVDDGSDPVADLVPDDERFRYVQIPHGYSLGLKRNVASALACGEILMQWDDDDWYGPTRIEKQVRPLIRGQAEITGLDNSVFFALPAQRFWKCSNDVHNRMYVAGVIGGTLTFFKDLWERSARYPDWSLAEDAEFLRQALDAGARLVRVPSENLFMYIRHGRNTWRFEPGRFVEAAGWRVVPAPAFLPARDHAFYRRVAGL
jgi:glycosyltransferase involved in cell wall biosynthesis